MNNVLEPIKENEVYSLNELSNTKYNLRKKRMFKSRLTY